MIRHILWDVENTLFDSYPAVTYAVSKTLNDMGLLVAINVVDSLARQSLEICLHALANRFKLDLDLLRRRVVTSYLSVSPEKQPPFPGVAEVCKLIQTRGGRNIAITDYNSKSTQALLDAHGLAPYFSDIFSTDQDYPPKPDPAIIRSAIKKHHLLLSETLVIGDQDVDIQAGMTAGTRTCFFGETGSVGRADFQVGCYVDLLGQLQAMI